MLISLKTRMLLKSGADSNLEMEKDVDVHDDYHDYHEDDDDDVDD